MNFGDLGSLQLWGGGGWMGVGWVDGGGVGGWRWGGQGCPHKHAHAHAYTHADAHTCMHGEHDNFMQMATPLDFWGIPGNSL